MKFPPSFRSSQLAARSSPWASRGLGLPESFAEFLREVQDFFAEALAHLERMGDGHLILRKFGTLWLCQNSY